MNRREQLCYQISVAGQQQGDGSVAKLGIVSLSNELLCSFVVSQLDKGTIGRLARLDIDGNMDWLRSAGRIWQQRLGVGKPFDNVGVASRPRDIIDSYYGWDPASLVGREPRRSVRLLRQLSTQDLASGGHISLRRSSWAGIPDEARSIR